MEKPQVFTVLGLFLRYSLFQYELFFLVKNLKVVVEFSEFLLY